MNIKKLQQVELKILEQFINICNKENLQYYVLGGTLLGAVRHKGFIPWDDDIDVAMPRKDYEKFLNVAQKYLSQEYFLQTYISDKEYFLNFAKIRNSNTTFIQNCFSKCNMNHGIYIDIFILDYYPINKIKCLLLNLKNKIFLFRINEIYNLSKADYSLYKKFCVKSLAKILKIFYPNIYSVLIKRDILFKSIKKSNLITNYGGLYGKKEVSPIEWFGKGINLQFENLTVKAPIEYDKYLTQIYGNYMKLPPKEKQISNHPTDIIDLEKPYTEYIKKGNIK
ncbi:LicD family protein [Candidatus Ruminimicrobium bovinum]|uniref:LicD family protein n=1 Tax=Candidatus Ruminimicrobium bovinum TaxID=3242779 RepID=UPI0039B8D821